MPYVQIRTAVSIPEEKKDALHKSVGALLEIIPGKTIDKTMTDISDGCSMYKNGAPAKALYCSISLFGSAEAAHKEMLTKRLHALFKEELGVESVYTSFYETNEWGANDLYRAK